MEPQAQNNLTLPTLLRRVGAVLLIAAGATFMFEGWHTLTSMQKYLSFLIFTFILTAAGLICARRLEDEKGARTFLGLAAATLPVHFSQLGAMILAVVSGPQHSLPKAFFFEANSPLAVGLAAILGICVVVPVAYLGFAALARTQAARLSALYALANACLLYPSRSAWLSAILITGISFIILWNDRHQFRHDLRMRTGEGMLARLLLWSPVMILAGRAMLYPVPDLLGGTLLLVVATAIFLQVPQYSNNKHFVGLAQLLTAPLFLWGWATVGDDLRHALHLNSDYTGLTTFLPYGIIAYLLSYRLSIRGNGLRSFAAYYAMFVTFLNLVFIPEILMSVTTIVFGIALIAAGFASREKNPLAAGILTMAIGIMYHLKSAFEFCAQSPWLSLGVIGILVLFTAAYLEKHAPRVVGRYHKFKTLVKGWQ
jgi:hypothetical protein